MLSIKNCRLQLHRCKDASTNSYVYGFLLIARGKVLDFYARGGREERDEWVEQLKQYVVLLDITDKIVTKNMIGEGNFAKVHLCYRKEDPK